MTEFGHLQQVDVRRLWPSEPADFTPWVASDEGLWLLSDWIGLPLENGKTEIDVGPFRADVTCDDMSDPANPGTVVIENQLEPSDHDHLGKLLTYAYGLRAESAIWIATEFAEEHLAAAEAWNKPSDRALKVYCVQVAVWRINGSIPAPSFNVIVRPNSQALTYRNAMAIAIPTGALDQFWDRFEDDLERETGWAPIHRRDSTFRSFGIGHPNACLSVVRDSDQIRARLYVYRGHEWLYRELEHDRRAINIELGRGVDWSSNKERSSIDLTRPSNLHDRAGWKADTEWMIDKLELLDRVFRDRLDALR